MKHIVSVFHYNRIGIKGDNGEEFCVMVSPENILDSSWAWFHTKEQVDHFLHVNKLKIGENLSERFNIAS